MSNTVKTWQQNLPIDRNWALTMPDYDRMGLTDEIRQPLEGFRLHLIVRDPSSLHTGHDQPEC